MGQKRIQKTRRSRVRDEQASSGTTEPPDGSEARRRLHRASAKAGRWLKENQDGTA